MFLMRRPSRERVLRWLDEQRRLPFSYADVGALGRFVPDGFDCDRIRVRIGTGAEAFSAARAALTAWKQFPSRMGVAFPGDDALAAGDVVATLFRAGPVWSLNACRIVAVIDERDERGERFGFTYGTLTGHIEHGEERFLIERDLADDSVWYELFCFSRPQHPLAQITKPFVRWKQGRFRTLSGEAIRAAVAARLRQQQILTEATR
ncbi:MAG: DUF1990 domain-containing protein [Planctomycetaceae bacterium]